MKLINKGFRKYVEQSISYYNNIKFYMLYILQLLNKPDQPNEAT